MPRYFTTSKPATPPRPKRTTKPPKPPKPRTTRRTAFPPGVGKLKGAKMFAMPNPRGSGVMLVIVVPAKLDRFQVAGIAREGLLAGLPPKIVKDLPGTLSDWYRYTASPAKADKYLKTQQETQIAILFYTKAQARKASEWLNKVYKIGYEQVIED